MTRKFSWSNHIWCGIIFHVATTWKSSLKDSIYKSIYNKTTAPAKKKSEPEKEKWRRRKEPRKNQTHHPGRASPRSREPGRVSPRSRDPSHDLIWLFLSLSLIWSNSFSLSLIWSDLVSLSLIWSDSFSLSDLIWSGEVRLRLRLKVF